MSHVQAYAVRVLSTALRLTGAAWLLAASPSALAQTLTYLGPAAAAPTPIGTDCNNPSSPASTLDWHFRVTGVASGYAPVQLDGLSSGGTWVAPAPPCDSVGHWPMLRIQAAPDTWDVYVEHWPNNEPPNGGQYRLTLRNAGGATTTVVGTIGAPSVTTRLYFSGTGNYGAGVGTVCGSTTDTGTTLDWNFRLTGVPTGYAPVQLDGMNGSGGGRWVTTCNTTGNWPLKVENKGSGVFYLYAEHFPNALPNAGATYRVTLRNAAGATQTVDATNNMACSKLSAQTLGTQPAFMSWAQATCPAFAKWFFDSGTSLDYSSMRALKNSCPFTRNIVRVYNNNVPATTGAQLWTRHFGALASSAWDNQALVDYVEGDNEADAGYGYGDATAATAWAGFIGTFVSSARNAGYRPIIGNIAVGNPGGDLTCPSGAAMQAFAPLVPAFQAAADAGGGWGYHAYTPEWNTDASSGGFQSFYALRYRRYVACFPALANVPLFLTEAGYDEGGDPDLHGYLGSGNGGWTSYQPWLTWFRGQIGADAYVASATLFAFSASNNWSSFRLDPNASALQTLSRTCP
jgi:hypothetical protein